jgi:hypothetical protein
MSNGHPGDDVAGAWVQNGHLQGLRHDNADTRLRSVKPWLSRGHGSQVGHH